MQTHTSGEVGIVGTVLLKVYSGAILHIFYWNWFIFDRQGAKDKLAVFFQRHGV